MQLTQFIILRGGEKEEKRKEEKKKEKKKKKEGGVKEERKEKKGRANIQSFGLPICCSFSLSLSGVDASVASQSEQV